MRQYEQGRFIRARSRVIARGIGARDPHRMHSWPTTGLYCLANVSGQGMCAVATGVVGMIKIDQYWMAIEPIDMRAGMETVLGKFVSVFGSAQAHHEHLLPLAKEGGVPLTRAHKMIDRMLDQAPTFKTRASHYPIRTKTVDEVARLIQASAQRIAV